MPNWKVFLVKCKLNYRQWSKQWSKHWKSDSKKNQLNSLWFFFSLSLICCHFPWIHMQINETGECLNFDSLGIWFSALTWLTTTTTTSAMCAQQHRILPLKFYFNHTHTLGDNENLINRTVGRQPSNWERDAQKETNLFYEKAMAKMIWVKQDGFAPIITEF